MQHYRVCFDANEFHPLNQALLPILLWQSLSCLSIFFTHHIDLVYPVEPSP